MRRKNTLTRKSEPPDMFIFFKNVDWLKIDFETHIEC